MKNILFLATLALSFSIQISGEELNITNEFMTGSRLQAVPEIKASIPALQSYQTHVWFHSVDISMSRDDNHNGFFHDLYIRIDADTSRSYQDVFAEYSLLPYRGPERVFYTSSVFRLYRQSSSDWLAIETELREDYPADHYLLTIRLFDANSGYLLAEISGFDTGSLDNLPLEDYYRDQRFNHIEEHQGGSSGIFALILTGLLTWRRYLTKRS